MNKDYLSKVLDKIMGETRMDDENKLTHTPFGSFPYFFNLSILGSPLGSVCNH